MTTAQGGLPAVRSRTRTTVVHDVSDDLPQVVREYVEQNFSDGKWPSNDPAVALEFIRRHFSDRAYKEHRP